jgi:phthiocerol/phenolphthiocerol synthesis type-I polyketide synthase E
VSVYHETMEGIAVVGMAGRFPGAKTIDEFWHNLKAGVESISALTDEAILTSGIDPGMLTNPNYVKAGAIVDDIDLFDAAFFGYNPREAAIIDPQQRLFLECAWQALENAGYDSEQYDGEIGTYAGVGWNSYLLVNIASNRHLLNSEIGHQTLLGNDKDHLTTRTSYKLNLTGPSITVQTGCSTSLVAIHLACQGLLSYHCDMALAGGITINVLQKAGYLSQAGGIMSPDGHCRAFDAKARGTVGGSGVGIVILKRLEDAIADGDSIHAVIKSSAINNDGALKVGYTAPSVERQAQVIAQAQALADIEAETISYVECHGSGTILGDPVEVRALTKAFRASTSQNQFCAIGSVKTNIGHLDAAAGVASLIKTVLALKHQSIPPSLHFEQPNPEIDFDNSPFYVNTTLSEWKTQGYPRRAGVSSFGLGGTNAHLILEEAPEIHKQRCTEPERGYQLVVLSAKTASVLETATANLTEYLKQHIQLNASLTNQPNPPNPPSRQGNGGAKHPSPTSKGARGEVIAELAQEPLDKHRLNLADIAYTLQIGRRAFSHRRVVVCQDIEDAIHALHDPKRILTSIQETHERPLAFMFPGLGTQYINMARELYQVEPTFRQQVDHCCLILKPLLNLDLREVLYPKNSQNTPPQNPSKPSLDLRKMLGRGAEPPDDATQTLNQTFLTQPAIFVIEYALAQLWMEWGIRPVAMIGYSIGEFVAATLAGVLSLEDALRLVAKRAQLIQNLPAGAMLAVPLSEPEIQPFLSENCCLSAINGASLCVISGEPEAVDELEQKLTHRGLACRRIVTSHGFHSTQMDAIAPDLRALVQTFQLHPPKIPYLSNVTGTWITAAQATDPNYWVQHLCQAVRFASGVEKLWQKYNPILLEVGPGQTLSSLALSILQKHTITERIVLPSLRHSYDHQSDTAFILNTLGQLWLAGVPINWQKIHAHQRPHRLPLPPYPFERQRYWIEPQNQAERGAISPTVSDEVVAETGTQISQHSRPNLRNVYVAPSNDLEAKIANLYQELLGIENVGIYDNFFELGGNSLIGIQLISQLRQEFQLELSLRSLFDAPAVAELALVIEEIILGELEELTEDEVNELVSDVNVPSDRFSTSTPPLIQQAYTLPNQIEIVHLSKAETDYFYQDIFEQHVYLNHGITINTGDCIFDVGAHVGLFTLWVNHYCKTAQIYAFEPAPPLFEILNLNTKRYEVNAELFNYGLSDESKTATLTFYPNSSGMSSFYPNRDAEKSILKAIMLNQVQNDSKSRETLLNYSEELLTERLTSQPFTCPLKSLSDVLDEQNISRIDLLKIDAYKSERDVLNGIKDQDWQKIKQLVIEVSNPEGQLTPIAERLKRQNYHVIVDKKTLAEDSAIAYIYARRK